VFDAALVASTRPEEDSVQDGTPIANHRRAMAFDCGSISRISPLPSGRPSENSFSAMPRRNRLDPKEWCTLERFARGLPILIDLLETPRRMDEGRHFPKSVGAAATQARRLGACPMGRSPGRWHVFIGKKGGLCVGKTKRGKGTKIMVLVDAKGLPLAVDVFSASPNEVSLIEPLLEKRVLRRRLPRLVYDRAADSDPLRTRLKRRGVDLICPHRGNRIKPATQDGRKLRRYKRRWKVERSISWLFNYRRLVVRYEHHVHLFLGLVQLACVLTVLKRF